jgi:hypothetical protein
MNMQEEFDVERTEIVNSHVRQRKDMTDMIAAMEQEFADAENELRQVQRGCELAVYGWNCLKLVLAGGHE